MNVGYSLVVLSPLVVRVIALLPCFRRWRVRFRAWRPRLSTCPSPLLPARLRAGPGGNPAPPPPPEPSTPPPATASATFVSLSCEAEAAEAAAAAIGGGGGGGCADVCAMEEDGVGVGGGSVGSGSGAPEEGYVLVRVHVPELNVQKCLQFPRDQLVWDVKQQCLAALPKPLFYFVVSQIRRRVSLVTSSLYNSAFGLRNVH
ncbi:Uncharacterized protein GBIM_06694 [Gryllus bimaculatus]|nr:Uncharacterized protein GBIM_06694 [Gryllus bimaculatus]